MTGKILKIISEEEFFSFLLKVIRYINKYICGIVITPIYETNLEKSVPNIVSDLNLSFRKATKKDIDSMDAEHYDYDLKEKQFFKEQLAKGSICILAIQNGKIIGYEWVMNNNQMELSEFNIITMSKKRVYGFKGFTIKECRGKRVQNALNIYLLNMLKKAGIKFFVATIDINNKPMIKSIERAGYKRIGYIIKFRFLGLKYDYIKKKDLLYLQNP
jgi:hypothetical protein